MVVPDSRGFSQRPASEAGAARSGIQQDGLQPSAAHGTVRGIDGLGRSQDHAQPRATTSNWQRLAWLSIGAVAATAVNLLIQWPAERYLNTAFPPPGAHFSWSANVTPSPPEETDKLRMLRQCPPGLSLLHIYGTNDGRLPLAEVTFLVACDEPIVAHMIPGALRARDQSGATIHDQIRHFSYKRTARLTYEAWPPELGLSTYVFFPSTSTCEVLCLLDDELSLPDGWDELSPDTPGPILPLKNTLGAQE